MSVWYIPIQSDAIWIDELMSNISEDVEKYACERKVREMQNRQCIDSLPDR